MNERRSRVKRRGLQRIREQVVDAVRAGVHPEDVAVTLGVGRSSVFRWIKMANAGESLEVKPSPGGKEKLTQGQRDRLVRLIVGHNPQQLQFDFALWTRKLVAELIMREFGVSYSLSAVGALLHRLGLSPQRPLVRAYEQDPQRVAAWKAVEFPALQARAKVRGARIFFADEAGVRSDHHAGTTWAPVGVTPVVRGTGARFGMNMVSAVSARGEFHFEFIDGNGNSETFIEFCRKLLTDVEFPVFLVVDGHSSHRSRKTRDFVSSTEGRLELHFLPPYSPELNPDEWVWKNVKNDQVAKKIPRTKSEMKEAVEVAVHRLKACPEIVRGFFGDPDLAYIGGAC